MERVRPVQSFTDFLYAHAEQVSIVVAGAAGGFIRAMQQKSGFRQLFSDIAVGMVLAYYIGPHVSSFSKLPPELGGFVCGVAGMMLVEVIMAAVRQRQRHYDMQDKDENNG
jgi:uncharacterized membrane protein YeaQ/YmgE (transglycosylase-associated protein family)